MCAIDTEDRKNIVVGSRLKMVVCGEVLASLGLV